MKKLTSTPYAYRAQNITGAMIISSMNITVEANGDVNIW